MRTLHEQFGVGSLVPAGIEMGRHIIHFAMAALGKPGPQPFLGVARVDAGEADRSETQFAAPAPDVVLEPPHLVDIAMHAGNVTLALADEAATLALGAALASRLARGMVVWLEGDLGAGKTTLVRGLLRAAGEAGPVKSPTYTLVEVHPLSGLNFYHFDFYRFERAEDYLDAGLDEYFSGEGVCLVEWPERAAPYLQRPDMQIDLRLAAGGVGRDARIAALTERGRTCLAAVTSSASPPPA